VSVFIGYNFFNNFFAIRCWLSTLTDGEPSILISANVASIRFIAEYCAFDIVFMVKIIVVVLVSILSHLHL
jgi:hypothetical protein